MSTEPNYVRLPGELSDSDGLYYGVTQCGLCGALVVEFPADAQKIHTEWHAKQEQSVRHAALGFGFGV